jgi:hypothetical protein
MANPLAISNYDINQQCKGQSGVPNPMDTEGVLTNIAFAPAKSGTRKAKRRWDTSRKSHENPFSVCDRFKPFGGLASEPCRLGEQPSGPVVTSAPKEGTSIDCSRETWPDFSAACLINARAVEVRKVSVNRRY